MDEPEITAVRTEGTDAMGPLVALPSSPPWVRTDPQIIERLERIEAKLDWATEGDRAAQEQRLLAAREARNREEAQLLGVMVLFPHMVVDMRRFLPASPFESVAHQAIWDALKDLGDDNVSLVSLKEWLGRVPGRLESAGGVGYLAGLVTDCRAKAPSVLFGRYIDAVIRYSFEQGRSSAFDERTVERPGAVSRQHGASNALAVCKQETPLEREKETEEEERETRFGVVLDPSGDTHWTPLERPHA